MDFDALEGYGVERGVIKIWKQELGRTLLAIQERAVRSGLLAGRNLIVFAPTSSGKTAVGEMAAVKAAKEGKRVFYLVPLKALAEEKYREFRARYEPLGIEVVVSSRDHTEFDERILGERYRLAIATFEKLAALLIAKPAVVESVGLVVADELQMIGDAERGGTLEVLLTKLRLAKRPPQIVASPGLPGWRLRRIARPRPIRGPLSAASESPMGVDLESLAKSLIFAGVGETHAHRSASY